MTPERWQQITAIFQAALQQPGSERAAFVSERCGNDDSLQREVDAMLASHDQASRFIEEPAINVAGKQSSDGASLIGQTIAHYQVLALIGSGGMGDVYLALDTKLGRKVALKLLPEYLAGDPQRTRLFTKEARAASALNHPNIITIHEIGQFGDRYYIAMEYVEGETLRSHIYEQKTPLTKLLKYLQQVAEGLTKAHANGIVHRDLKPDNIMITSDGYAKILDFGLAKLLEQPHAGEASDAATALMTPLSVPGMVMGTVGYMSPEQAQGKSAAIDHRSDIFSFGCILFETTTGRKAFEGSDLIDSLHKIIHAPTPSIKSFSGNVIDDLDRVVRRCLAKDPDKRYQSIKDVAIELEELRQELKLHTTSAPPVPNSDTQTLASTTQAVSGPTSSAEYLLTEIKRHRTGVLIIAAAFVLAGAGLLLYLARQGYFAGNRVESRRPINFERMKMVRLTTSGKVLDASVSPDGKYVAYLKLESGASAPSQQGSDFGLRGTGSIWIRQIATGRDVMIVEPGFFIYRGLTFSRDGNYIYYRTQVPGEVSWVYRVSVLGGDPEKVIRDSYSPLSFSRDGKYVAFVRNSFPIGGNSSLMIANADGTAERILVNRPGAELFATPGRPTAPAWSPDGTMLACVLGGISGSVTLLTISVSNGTEKVIGNGPWSTIDSLAWLPDGSGLMVTGRDPSSPLLQIWHVAYPSGESHRVTNDLNDYRGLSMNAEGNMMVVVPTSRESDIWLVPTAKPSDARALTTGTAKADGAVGLSWTPDGKIVYASTASGNRDIWLLDVNKGTQKQLTSNARQNYYPQVTPDGRHILFLSDRGETLGIWRMDVDGTNATQLVSGAIQRFTSSGDGKWIIYSGAGPKGMPILWKLAIDGGQPVILNEEYWEEFPAASPDGKQVTFQYVRREGGAMIGQISLDGGTITDVAKPPFRFSQAFRWTPDGMAVAYIDNSNGPGQIWALPSTGGPARQLTNFTTDSIFWFDWSRDGKQLAVARGTQLSDVVLISDFR